MAETKNTVMPETGVWPAGIYQIETSDPVLGYDTKTDVDGPANIQWEQLANRTRYLRNLFLVGHTEEGRHQLTDDDFVTAAGIKEENIDLAYPTQALSDDLDELLDDISATYDLIDTDIRHSLLGLTWAMHKIIPLVWERQGDHSVFEMFTDSMHLSTGKSFHVFKSVYDAEQGMGDDSVDVTDTGWNTDDASKMLEGEQYVLSDAADSSKWQFVSIYRVLNNQRILLNEEAQYTITDGWLRPANVAEGSMKATAASCFAWVSAPIPALGEDAVTVTIRHDEHTDCIPVVEYHTDDPDDDEWHEASSYSKSTEDNHEDDVCVLPVMQRTFTLRVSYASLEVPVTFSMIALVSRHEYDVIEPIRRPSVESASVSGSNVVISGSDYLSLYELGQGGMDAQLSRNVNFIPATTVSHSGTGTQITTSRGGAAYVRVRYIDIEGTESRWSEPEAIG